MSHSQQEEEDFVLRAVAEIKPGRFLDIGAADGQTFSNTLALAERGWGGVCVEADAEQFRRLTEQHSGRPSVACVQAVVGPFSGIVRFWSCSDLVGTTEPSIREKWAPKVAYRDGYAAQVPLDSILLAFPGDFAVVSIDTEGTSADIWEALDADAVGCRVAVVEYDHHKARVIAHGERFGMRLLYENGTNVVMAR